MLRGWINRNVNVTVASTGISYTLEWSPDDADVDLVRQHAAYFPVVLQTAENPDLNSAAVSG